ncbi:MAG: hypothetical protein KatS3mg110_3757 [Pirellulaceae bacterium]|nr:MAG: hypothetical protein KatS3mg110_3757 [Pirellulaceae bacterium]
MEPSLSNNLQNEIDWPQALPWIEFGCWFALLIAPFIYWVHGPSVSIDQAVSRTAVVIVAILGVAACRWWRWCYRSRIDQLPPME